MLHVDLPTRSEIEALAAVRADPCVTLYLSTTPLTQGAQADRIALKNLFREAVQQLREADTAKRSLWPIEAEIDDLIADDEFWTYQANSLAIFATPETIRTYRLPNRLESMAQVSDRFHIKPILRSIAFPRNAWVLVLAEGDVRLHEISAGLPPHVVRVPDLPRDAASSVGQSTLNDRSPKGRVQGSEGKNTRLSQYARAVDHALRPVLAGHERPLILAAAEPLSSIYRQVNSHPRLAVEVIRGNSERLSETELSVATQGVLDRLYAAEIAALAELYTTRESQGRATTDIAQAARAATFGAIDTLIVDMDAVVPGMVDDLDGAVTFAEVNDAATYGVVDEITSRALRAGARVVAAHRADVPCAGDLAAILRYAI